MDIDQTSIEELITSVLVDIQQKGFSAIQPFSIGDIEQRMKSYAETNNIVLACDQLYMSAKQLQHCMRASKNAARSNCSSSPQITAAMPPFRTSWLYLIPPFTLQR